MRFFGRGRRNRRRGRASQPTWAVISSLPFADIDAIPEDHPTLSYQGRPLTWGELDWLEEWWFMGPGDSCTTDAAAMELLRDTLAAGVRWANNLTFPLPIWRGVITLKGSVPHRGKGDYHWTPLRSMALRFAYGESDAVWGRRYYPKEDTPWLLSGTLRTPDEVDWEGRSPISGTTPGTVPAPRSR